MEMLRGVWAKQSEKHFAISIIILFFLVGCFASFMSKTVWPIVPGFISMCGISIFFTSLQTAFLLYNQSKLDLDSSVALLAAGYLAVSLLALARIIFLPGIILDLDYFGVNTQATAWIWTIWHLIFPCAVILYSLKNLNTISCNYKASQLIFKLTPIAAFSTILLLVLIDDSLPILVKNNNYAFTAWMDLSLLILTAISLVILLISRRINYRQDVWLALAVIVHGLDIFYGLVGEVRYSAGWYLGMINSVISSSLILGVFIYQILNFAKLKNEETHYFKYISEIDPLTKIPNRRKFDTMLTALWELGLEQNRPLCLIMIDVDNFKAYNDSLGHPTGDKCLISIAKQLSQIPKRTTDFTARLGGEEFAILLYGADKVIGFKIAEQTRKSIESLKIPHPTSPSSYVTISVGMVSLIPDVSTSHDVFLNMADQALYKAKTNGRNRVESL